MNEKQTNLLPCPFCGGDPDLPEAKDVCGTCYEVECSECGVPSISIQIIDCFYHEERPSRSDAYSSWDSKEMKYGDEFIEVARGEAIKIWNTRVSGE